MVIFIEMIVMAVVDIIIKKYYFLIFIILFGFQVNRLEAQNDDYTHELDSILGIDHLFKEEINPIEEQYKQFMAKANELYKEQKYAEAVVYYRKALKTKPEERLPQYKIEDVYTLFLVNNVVKTKEEAQRLVAEVEMSFDNADNEELFVQKASEVKQEEVVEELKPISEPRKAIPILVVEEKPVVEVEKIEATQIEVEKPIQNENLEVREVKVEQVKPIVKEEPKPQPVVEKVEISPVAKEDENKKLLAQYPDEKTIETFEDVNKKITRVIINRNGEIVVYEKVKHSWGGIFFFAKYPGLEKKNISEQHFVKSTQ